MDKKKKPIKLKKKKVPIKPTVGIKTPKITEQLDRERDERLVKHLKEFKRLLESLNEGDNNNEE
jgi:hypothetical protein